MKDYAICGRPWRSREEAEAHADLITGTSILCTSREDHPGDCVYGRMSKLGLRTSMFLPKRWPGGSPEEKPAPTSLDAFTLPPGSSVQAGATIRYKLKEHTTASEAYVTGGDVVYHAEEDGSVKQAGTIYWGATEGTGRAIEVKMNYGPVGVVDWHASSGSQPPRMAQRDSVCSYCGLTYGQHPSLGEWHDGMVVALCNGYRQTLPRPQREPEVCDEDRRAIGRAKGDR